MNEGSAEKDSDLRAGKYVAALRSRLGYTPERLAPMCGVGASTIRAIEKLGVIPQLATQERLAEALGLPKERIWTRAPQRGPRRRSPSQRLQHALHLAGADVPALRVREGLPDGDDFLYGVAWAVIRSQNPYATPDVVAEKARMAVLGG